MTKKSSFLCLIISLFQYILNNNYSNRSGGGQWWVFTSPPDKYPPLATSTWVNNSFIQFVFRNAIMLNFNISQVTYRPFSTSKCSHFQNEAKCKTFPVKTSFLCVRIKTHFHISAFAVSLALEQRQLENGLLTTPENTITYHNALCLLPQNFA